MSGQPTRGQVASTVGRQPLIRNGVEDMAEVEKKPRVAIVGGGLVREKTNFLFFTSILR